jgi:hypothetical protein
LAGVVPGLWTHTVVYQIAGGVPGFDPTDGRKTSVPVKLARAVAAHRAHDS